MLNQNTVLRRHFKEHPYCSRIRLVLSCMDLFHLYLPLGNLPTTKDRQGKKEAHSHKFYEPLWANPSNVLCKNLSNKDLSHAILYTPHILPPFTLEPQMMNFSVVTLNWLYFPSVPLYCRPCS